MTEELELKQFPVEGLTSKYRTQEDRDIHMANHQRIGFEVQPWKVKTWWGEMHYGFSYSKTRHISQKQKAEFERLKKDVSCKS